MALARKQLATQSPPFEPEVIAPPESLPAESGEQAPESLPEPVPMARPLERGTRVAHATKVKTSTTGATAKANVAGIPGWPNARGFVPPGPCMDSPQCQPTEKIEPVLEHTKTYNGQDAEFTAALASFVSFQDDARFGGWQNYLQRSDDFIRFCCRMHIYELLSARGGAGESRVVWRWPAGR
jgi:hypothetical protein